MRAAQKAGAQLYCMEQDHLFLRDQQAFAVMTAITVTDDNDNWYSLGETVEAPLTDLNAVFMRKDPPVDKRFIHTTYVLEQAEQDGVLMVNPAHTLRKFNEKIFATAFPEYTPAYTIGADKSVFETFLNTHEKIIMKPLDGMGGEGVFKVEKGDVNFSVIWETLTNHGQYPIVAQKFVPEISAGDKRILIIDGQAFPYMLVRLPQDGSIRGNLAVSGDFEVRELSDKDHEIANAVGQRLKQENILLAGIDIIGEALTEVNITSPTGFREIANVTGMDPAHVLVEKVFQLLEGKKAAPQQDQKVA